MPAGKICHSSRSKPARFSAVQSPAANFNKGASIHPTNSSLHAATLKKQCNARPCLVTCQPAPWAAEPCLANATDAAFVADAAAANTQLMEAFPDSFQELSSLPGPTEDLSALLHPLTHQQHHFNHSSAPAQPLPGPGSAAAAAAAAAAGDTSLHNRPGLNGLTVGGTSGLATGCFSVSATMPVHYTVQEVSGIFEPHNKALLRGVVPGSFPFALGPEPAVTTGLRRLVVIDSNVGRIYGQQIRAYFAHHGVEAQLLPLPTCEENKHFGLVEQIAEAIEGFKINRRSDPIIAIGGGVCLDVAGLAANLYRRNTAIIKVPTTVMAVVDASVGIKTAVNFGDKKNKLGTYCPPLGVLCDVSLLTTLDARHISNGAAEMLKMACIKDAPLFELLEGNAQQLVASKFQSPAGAAAIRRSIQGMLEELEYNLWEAHLARLVDYGHTISPELEMAALRSPSMLLHGEAVAIDMALTTELAWGRGLLSDEQRGRVLGLLRCLRLPLWHEACSVKLFMKGLEDMTRTRDGLQRTPLMNGIGAAVFVDDISEQEMAAAATRLAGYAAEHGCVAAAEAVAKMKSSLAVKGAVAAR
uniref:Uncharacterized protein n=1 Tax=Tetradesmus obliquus TaxID=3088 RepID=A0A383V683_TETOB|eukprot:jgi/Sobl393_1/306/SZX60094.1